MSEQPDLKKHHKHESEAGAARRERRRNETRERLYEVAMQLLSERGFEAVTVETITAAADVSKGTFFNYFESKEAVVGYRFERQLQILTEMLEDHPDVDANPSLPGIDTAGIDTAGIDGMNTLLDPSTNPSIVPSRSAVGPIWRRLMAITAFISELDGQNRLLMRSLLALSLSNDLVRNSHLGVKVRALEQCEMLLHAGQESGEFRNDVPARQLAEYLFHIYFAVLYRWTEQDADYDLREAIKTHYTLAWNSIRA